MSKPRAFIGARSAREKAILVGHWFKAAALGDAPARTWCINHGIALTKAQAEGVNYAGGFLAPRDFDDVSIRMKGVVFSGASAQVPWHQNVNENSRGLNRALTAAERSARRQADELIAEALRLAQSWDDADFHQG